MSRSNNSADGVLRLAYAGDDSFVTCLQALLDRDDILLTHCLTADDRRYTATIEQLAADHGAAVIHGDPGPDGWSMLNAAGIDLLVSAAYANRIPVETLSIETKINVHPSYLPHGRGPNPLLHLAGAGGEAGTWPDAAGVTVHLLDENFDTGPILLQQQFEDLPAEPSLVDLTLMAMAVAPALLNTLLDQLDLHVANASAQTKGSYWPNVRPEDRVVDLAVATGKDVIEAVHRFSCQGFDLRLADGSVVCVKSANFTATPAHGFEPGRLLGRLRGDYVISVVGGLVRGVPFSDDL